MVLIVKVKMFSKYCSPAALRFELWQCVSDGTPNAVEIQNDKSPFKHSTWNGIFSRVEKKVQEVGWASHLVVRVIFVCEREWTKKSEIIARVSVSRLLFFWSNFIPTQLWFYSAPSFVQIQVLTFSVFFVCLCFCSHRPSRCCRLPSSGFQLSLSASVWYQFSALKLFPAQFTLARVQWRLCPSEPFGGMKIHSYWLYFVCFEWVCLSKKIAFDYLKERERDSLKVMFEVHLQI